MNLRLAIWLLLAAICILVTNYRYQPGWLQTDIVSLAQNTEKSPALHAAQRRLSAQLQQNLLWVLVSPRQNTTELVEATQALAEKLTASSAIEQVEYSWAEAGRYKEEWALLFPARQQLLSRADRNLLAKSPDKLAQRQLQKLYGLQGSAANIDLQRDPFATFRNYFVANAEVSAQVYRDIPVQQSGANQFTLIRALAKPLQLHGRIETPLLQLRTEMRNWAEARGLQLLVAGAPLHAEHAAAGAQREIRIIGGLSLLAICLLSLLVFRSARPLLLCLFAIASGIACGTAAVITLLGTMHILAFVFGTTVTGLAIDYAFHFICNRLRPGLARDGDVLPGLLLGLLSSCLAFFSLALTPFPLLQQMGIFVGFGLLGAWLTVVLLFPALLRVRTKMLQLPGLLQRRQNTWYFPAIGILCASGLFALTQIKFASDLQLFYQPPQHLVQEEQSIKKLAPARPESTYFLVEGEDWQQVIQREWQLTDWLQELTQQSQLGRFQALTQKFPPLEVQKRNWDLMETLYSTETVKRFYTDLGFSKTKVQDLTRELKQPFASLSLPDWLAVAGGNFQDLWLGCTDGRCASVVRLYGVKQPLQPPPIDGVALVDPLGRMAEAMSAQRDQLLKIFPLILLIAFAVIALKTGAVKALSIIALPVAAVAAALAAIALAGSELNIFHVAGLLLVFGIGVDYAVFGHLTTPREKGYTFLAIAMAGLTTLLGFGLLALSQTPAIADFGFTLAVGTTLTLLLAILFFTRVEKR